MSEEGRISGEQGDTEENLHARVKEAERRNREASAEYKRLLAIHHDLGNTADGAVALRKAIQMQQAATIDYSTAIRELSEFILRRSRTLARSL